MLTKQHSSHAPEADIMTESEPVTREKPARSMGTKAAPPRDLAKEAYVSLREEISDGTLSPGTRITETDISERLNMSRTPVREAIYKLESEGLLTHVPRSGLVVTRLDHQMIMELYTLREALEGTAARLAAQHASDIEIEALTELIEKAGAQLSDGKEFAGLSDKIHGLIYLAAHNRFLLRSLENIASTLSLLPRLSGGSAMLAEWHRQHQLIVAAIQNRDPDAAEAAARTHIRTARKLRLERLI
jgi:DNA-binding GntR family transcriptional regulator